MKKQFQALNELKPSPLAKAKLMEKLEENEMKKHNSFKMMSKVVIGCMLAVGCLSIPFIQNSMETSITTKAKQIEVLNKQMEEANEQYEKNIITHEEYLAIITPLEDEIDKAIAEAKAIDPNIKFKVIQKEDIVNENGEVEISYDIIEEK